MISSRPLSPNHVNQMKSASPFCSLWRLRQPSPTMPAPGCFVRSIAHTSSAIIPLIRAELPLPNVLLCRLPRLYWTPSRPRSPLNGTRGVVEGIVFYTRTNPKRKPPPPALFPKRRKPVSRPHHWENKPRREQQQPLRRRPASDVTQGWKCIRCCTCGQVVSVFSQQRQIRARQQASTQTIVDIT